jgi:hypothetical protein
LPHNRSGNRAHTGSGLALYLRNRARPLLLFGAERDIQRRVTQAHRDGHPPDPYVDALATDFAVRQAKQQSRWSFGRNAGGYSGGGVNVPIADSRAAATRYIRSSANVGAIT